MLYKLEMTIKLLCFFAPIVFFILPSSAMDSENLLAFFVFGFPYFVILAFTQFIKQKNTFLVITIATLSVLLIISSAAMLFGTGSDPQSSIGVFFVYMAQALSVSLFVSIYFVIRVFSSINVHNKSRRDTNR